MLRFVKYLNKSQFEGAAGRWYLRLKADEQIGINELAEHMSSHNTPFSKGAIVGILTDLVGCIKEQMLDGKTVKFADLAIFSLGVHCKGAAKPEDLTAANIKSYRFNARGTGEMSPKRVAAIARVKELDIYDISIDETPATGA